MDLIQRIRDNFEIVIKSKPVRIIALTAWTVFSGTCFYLYNESVQQYQQLQIAGKPIPLSMIDTNISPEYQETSLVFLYRNR